MKNVSILASMVVAVFGLYSCSQNRSSADEKDGLQSFSAQTLGQHIAVLSSDSFQGRKPFTPGETITINYLRQQFEALGLEPGNGKSFFQEVPMVNIATTAAPTMAVQSARGNLTLKGFDDYVIWTDKTDSAVSLNNNEVVFAGYGVVAPELNWNDYEGLDVKDKIVLVLVNDPGFNSGDTTLFKGKSMTYYGRWTYKFEEAGRQGAKGCLIVHNAAGASYPFTVVQNNWNGSRLRLDNRGKEEKNCDVIGWISADAAKKLLQAAGADSTLLAKADQKGFKPVPLNVRLSTSISVKATYNKSHNVVAKITGSKHPDETIIYSAHWDHLGFGKPDETGDSIYNGALDNASGTAGLLELAKAFKSMKTKPERSVIFLAVTAEEQGLWGSAWYAQNPIYPADKTVANINMDGINQFEKTKDIVIIGEGQSELEDYVTEEAKKAARYVSFETHPEAGYYYRSDHFNFAKIGIPALYIKKGIDIDGKGKELGQQNEDAYREKHYHRPSDEYDANTWSLAGGIEDLKLLFQVGKRLAFGDKLPTWKEGSEFKSLRKTAK
jgi:Zn-dependent M28 family amino/carboxypeptidase